jgi:nitronate monooxygenase
MVLILPRAPKVIGPLEDLGLRNPVMAAPMSGGPTTPEMVLAAARAGSMGFLAGGYKTVELLSVQIEEVRSSTSRFGVNLFAPNPVPISADAYSRYAGAIQTEGDVYGIDLASTNALEDDDEWRAKVDYLITNPVPVVSFTFGIPDSAVISALRKAGSLVMQTVTSVEEALLAERAGADILAVQGYRAGGHSGTTTPTRLPESIPLADLVERIRKATSRPLVAAGGLATSADIATVLQNGAGAVMVGTALLRSPESGASATHKAALASRSASTTVITRAFTGRPARAVPNLFTEHFDAIAPLGYPAVHHLTIPLRRAATAAGDPERINLWAGTGFGLARDDPVASTLSRLAEEL